jgi:nucleotide-binding universal stress UspA family protein
MFERVLVPLDGSPRGERVLPTLDRLLRRADAELLLLRAVRSPRERSAAQAYLLRLLGRFRGSKVHGRVMAGPAADAILRAADEEGVTLIAMAADDVAPRVLRDSRVPLLLAREHDRPIRKILVPVDGKPSAAALRPAVKLAQICRSRGVFLHVVPGPPPPDDPVTAAAARRFEAVDLRSSRRTVTGDPAAEILKQAAAEDVDLIAMATHGRKGLPRALLGSVAERVIRASPVPMLVLRG